MELKKRIEEKLNILEKGETEKAINVFRDIFINIWNFNYHDEEIPKECFDEFVMENTDFVRIIAKTNPSEGECFYIVYVKSKSDTVKYRQKLIKQLINFTGSFDITFANFIVIIEYSDYWKLIIPTYKKETENTKLNIYVIDPEDKKFRTLVENLAAVANEITEKMKKTGKQPPAIVIKEMIDEYMHVRPLTNEFFKEYKEYYNQFKEELKKRYAKELEKAYRGELPKEIFVERAIKAFVHTFFNRLMFIYFLQKKGWIVEAKKGVLPDNLLKIITPNVKKFIKWLYEQYEEYGGEFYKDYMRVLFLHVMNTPREENARKKVKEIQNIPSPIVRDIFTYGVPYFNGGLFSPVYEEDVNIDEIITSIPDNLVKKIIFDFFESYNFTITEETPYEVEVAVDPAMLGQIYESLIAEEERGVSGIFYTPRDEVDFMCRMAVYEYLKNNLGNKISDEFLREFIFTPLYNWEYKAFPRGLIEALNTIKIVDPAAGSGAFLVGMFHLLTELYEKLDVKVDYDRKLQIIRENIYGVDVKEWAIRVAKLRLWLALIEQESKIPAEPILPNLETKLCVGDSLAPPHFIIKLENGKKFVLAIPLHKWRESLRFKSSVEGPIFWINQYKELSKKYYYGEVCWEELEDIKKKILELFADKVLDELVKDKKLQKDAKLLKQLVSALKDKKFEKSPFIWELDFPEVMFNKGGFDIVIANPPYVRQEKIYPEYFDLTEFEMLDKKEQEKLKKSYKERIIKHMEIIINEKFKSKTTIKLNKKSDLYVYFFIQGVNILNPKGTLVFITSNSWLDVDYGTQLQEFFLRFTNLKRIIDYTSRSFQQADVNTVITVLTRKPEELFNTVGDDCVNFILLKKNFNELNFEIINKMLDCYVGKVKEVEVFGGKVYSYEDDDIRVRSIKAVDLAKMGGIEIGMKHPLLGAYNIFGEYMGMKWGGILIRAPRIFYVILDKGKDKLVKLGDIAEIKRGFTTGANEFFYLEPIKNPIEWPVCKICGRVHKPEEGLVAVKNKAGWEGYIEKEFLKPTITSTREIKTYVVSPAALNRVMLYCPLSLKELEDLGKKHILSYIRWGESRGYPSRRTLQGRRYWWILPVQEKHDFVILRFRDQRNWTPILPENVQIYAGDVVFVGIYKQKYKPKKKFLDAILNSTIHIFSTEIVGRTNLGDGLLTVYGPEIQVTLVINPYRLSPITEQRLIDIFAQMANRKVKSIFEELGLPKPNKDLSNINPEDVSLDKVLPDRRELDKVIFEALGLTEEEQLEVYRAVVELVKQRLKKAKSFT